MGGAYYKSVPGVEFITENGQQKTLTYLSGPGGVFALHVINHQTAGQNLYYIHTDHLGSWHTITDEYGNLLQELSFDAWGNRRNPATWRAFTGTPPPPMFDRGFTGHEHLYGFQLINMNGRMYDPVVSRMLSPDNFIQAPDFSQSFNRYSYAWNNPLVFTDPDGEIIGFLIAGAVIGAYIGGAYAEGDLNPGNWAWNNNTWKGIIAGGLIGTATGGVIGAMWSAGATVSIGANVFGNSVPLISFSQAGYSTANTVAGLIGIGGVGVGGAASIDYGSLNTHKALNEIHIRAQMFDQAVNDWQSSITGRNELKPLYGWSVDFAAAAAGGYMIELGEVYDPHTRQTH
jgi:RHS repeat-associated protein